MKEHGKVLVVDDEEVVRHSYGRSLEGICCNVRMADDGTEALRLMEEDPSDVILVDIRMPGMDGIELLQHIKRKWPESEVVVITGYPSIDSAKEAVRLGAYNYLAKPIGPEEVVEAARNALNQKGWSLRKEDSGAGGSAQRGNHYRWEN